MNNSWHIHFIQMAHFVAQKSKDASTKVGCVLVRPETCTEISYGFNGFPRGVREEMPDDPTKLDIVRWARPTKYSFVTHAERNAIYNAARNGHRTEGCYAYLNWSPDSICSGCAQALIQAGIVKVYGPWCDMTPKPGGEELYDTFVHAKAMLEEAGVEMFCLPHIELRPKYE